MKAKKLLSLILAIAMLSCMLIMPANAAETETDEIKSKAIAFYTNGGEEQEGISTYGLTCTLLGHKLETTGVYKITHEVRSTSPRCLKKSYDYSACTRCDYEESVLVRSEYIVCC